MQTNVFAMKTPHIRPKCIQVFVSYTFIKNHPVLYTIIVRLTFSGIRVMLESLLENHIYTDKNLCCSSNSIKSMVHHKRSMHHTEQNYRKICRKRQNIFPNFLQISF